MNETLGFKKIFSSAGLQTALLLAFFLLLAFRPVNDPDFGWHLKAGEYIVQNLSVPETDIFSYTNPDYPSVHNSFLSEALFYGLYKAGGGSLIFVTLFFFFAAILFFLFLLPNAYVRPKEDSGKKYGLLFDDRVLIGLLGLVIAWSLFYSNPLVFDYFGFILTFMLLERFKVLGEKRALFFLPLVYFMWMMLHSGFFIGFAMIGLFIAAEFLEAIQSGKGIKKAFKDVLFPLVILLVSAAVTLIGPYGWRLYQDSAEITSSPLMRDIQYWRPTFLGVPTYPFYAYLSLFLALLLFIRPALKLRFIFYFLFFLGIAFFAFRFFPFFVFATIPVLWGIDKENASTYRHSSFLFCLSSRRWCSSTKFQPIQCLSRSKKRSLRFFCAGIFLSAYRRTLLPISSRIQCRSACSMNLTGEERLRGIIPNAKYLSTEIWFTGRTRRAITYLRTKRQLCARKQTGKNLSTIIRLIGF
ncbi:MAG: hypothetical protein HYW88_02800 [Candidatus Sungbacteria bacterium]|nr:hypothetical protein [Candidatus Sungbacteria bacterium]